jgi:peptidoglycan/xylan/chitin deacetylase (PgdA/CDA1 family)
MKRIVLSLSAGLALALLTLGGVGAAVASADAGPNLLANPDLEAADGTGNSPAWWTPSTWNTVPPATQPKFTWSNDAHSGEHSVRIDVSNYTDGDSKWVPDLVPVKGNTYYNFSDWYKSDRSSAVSVYYVLSTDPDQDHGHWSNLFSGIAPASDWTQYKTGFTMPANAIKAQFVHFIAGNGYLETDDYSLTEQASPPGWSKPMISLTFDDGSQGFWDNARQPLIDKGFKTTQYVPTAGLTSNPHDPFLMTKDEISTLASEGNEIGGHSVTHPFLTQVSDAQLQSELVDSKQVLEAIPGVGTVHNFAYPYGDYDARVISAEEAAGYRSGRSVEEGYNSKLDLEPYDIRVQNMTPNTSLDQFKSWVDYAKAHNYWLVIVYHEVQPDSVPRCANLPTDPDPCLGDYDTTVTSFQSQLDYISSSGLGPDVVTVQQALDQADAEMRPVAGKVTIIPTGPATGATLTATPSGFSDPNNDALTYQYQWKVNGAPIAGATDPTFDLSAPGHGDHGDAVSVDVTAKDPGGRTSAGVSDSVTVADTAPVNGAVTITPASPTDGATLTATPGGFSDADGDALTYSYGWFRNDQPIAGATTSTLPASAYAAGDVISVEVRANDGHGGTSDPATATVTVAKATGSTPPGGTTPPGGATPGGATPPSGTTPPHSTPVPPILLKPTVDKTAPTIVVSSPKAGVYRIGRSLKISVSVSDRSGGVRWTATITRIGSKARNARQGKKLHLSRTGQYVLRVTAKDRWGNAAIKTVRFRVVHK